MSLLPPQLGRLARVVWTDWLDQIFILFRLESSRPESLPLSTGRSGIQHLGIFRFQLFPENLFEWGVHSLGKCLLSC